MRTDSKNMILLANTYPSSFISVIPNHFEYTFSSVKPNFTGLVLHHNQNKIIGISLKPL